MEHLKGKQLVKKDKTEAEADEVLADAEIVGFYFSAHWCGPCQAFTPILAKAYKEMKDAGYKFEVIFVTSDNDENAMFEYMNECHGDWYALPYDSEPIRELKKKYSIRGIPTLVVIKKDDDTIIREDGCDDVESYGADAYKHWIK
uniref:Nucleoredoxin-like protein 2 n=1 Tax=Hadrurus spadix TaxID=141984 RepID=A0A1W7RA17_9SCOR